MEDSAVTVRPKFPELKFAFFDVLGFKDRFAKLGLEGMLEKYLDLIGLVNHANERMKSFGSQNIDDAFWMGGGKKFVTNGIYGSYSSDSIVLWASNLFPSAYGKSEAELVQCRADNQGLDWKYYPVPNDRFIETCNELLCHALSVGLPLRGGLASGLAVIDPRHNIFLGQPIIDSVIIEGSQRVIGASLCKSIAAAGSPEAYVFKYKDHFRPGLKPEQLNLFSGHVLDWPAHWGRTRDLDLESVVDELAKEAGNGNDDVYRNTLELIKYSQDRNEREPDLFDRMFELPYPQFQRPGIGLAVQFTYDGKKKNPLFSVRGV